MGDARRNRGKGETEERGRSEKIERTEKVEIQQAGPWRGWQGFTLREGVCHPG